MPYSKLLPRAQRPFPAECDDFHTQCDVTGPVALDTTGVVMEVGFGILQFMKGSTMMLMPSQSSDDFEINQSHKKWTMMEPEGRISGLSSRNSNVYHIPNFFPAQILYLLHEHTFYPLSPAASISLHSATYLAALAIAHYAFFHISPFRIPDSVLIISCTPVSLFLIQLSNLQNASQIIPIERYPVLKKLIAAFGATHVLDPNDMDVPESVRLLTDDTGADVVLFYITDQPNTQNFPDESSPSTSLQHNPEEMNTAAYLRFPPVARGEP